MVKQNIRNKFFRKRENNNKFENQKIKLNLNKHKNVI